MRIFLKSNGNFILIRHLSESILHPLFFWKIKVISILYIYFRAIEDTLYNVAFSFIVAAYLVEWRGVQNGRLGFLNGSLLSSLWLSFRLLLLVFVIVFGLLVFTPLLLLLDFGRVLAGRIELSVYLIVFVASASCKSKG